MEKKNEYRKPDLSVSKYTAEDAIANSAPVDNDLNIEDLTNMADIIP